MCRLRHSELVNAAHILPDGHPRGFPIVPNGLAMCKLHHAAFDVQILGVRPDLTIELRKDVLRETDGPMLMHRNERRCRSRPSLVFQGTAALPGEPATEVLILARHFRSSDHAFLDNLKKTFGTEQVESWKGGLEGRRKPGKKSGKPIWRGALTA